MGRRVLHQETKGRFREYPGYVLKLGEDDGENPLHIALEGGHVIGCLRSESLLLPQKKLKLS
jgi:hypothetical protein